MRLPQVSFNIAMVEPVTAVGGIVKAKATVVNNLAAEAPMVMLDLPVPPGFAAGTEELAALVQRGTIARFQVRPRGVLVYLREYGEDKILCVANLARSAQPVELDLAEHRGTVPIELLGRAPFPPVGELPYLLTLPGHGFYWFQLPAAREEDR